MACPKLPNSPSQSILIILTGALGDVARGLVLPSIIKNQAPQHKITWLVEKKWLAYLQLSQKYLDDIIVFDRKGGIPAIIALVKTLRSKHFDIALDMQRILKSGLMSFFSGAKFRLGFHPKDCKEFNYIFNNNYIEEFGEIKSKQLNYFEFLKKLGLSDYSFEHYLQHEEIKEVSAQIRSIAANTYVIATLGSSWESKDWPLENYLEALLALIKKTNLEIVIVGDSGKKLAADSLVEQLKSSRVTSLVGKTSLAELTFLLQKAEVGFGSDSGPAHIAAAVGTPFVTIFGPTRIERTAPLPYLDYAINTNVPCGPCYKRVCPGYDGICLSRITGQQVADKIFNLLSISTTGKS